MNGNMNEELMATFALRDNPFDPVLEFESDEPAFSNLGRGPLAVHQAADLDSLYCESAGPFKEHVAAFERNLRWKGFRLDPPRRKGIDYIGLIAGDVGTGKTTLASKMLQVVQKYQPTDGPEWKTFDRLMRFDQSPDKFREEIEKLQNDIASGSGGGDYCCILIDNVRQSLLSHALSVFDRWEGTRWIFLFLTTSDLELIRSEYLNSPRPIKKFETRTLSADDAVAFVDARIQHFRDPELEQLQGDLRLYPYERQNIRDAVERLARPGKQGQAKEVEREREDPITLRVFNGYLDRHLLRHFDRIFSDEYRIANLTATQLAASQIDLRHNGGDA